MKIKGFTIVPDAIVQKYTYTGGLIYGKIARYCEWSPMQICTASNKRLAEELNMGESTVRKYKKLFEDDGLIRVVGKGGETDTVSIVEEMVIEMATPLLDSAPPLLDSNPTPLLDSNKDTSIKDTNKTGGFLELALSQKPTTEFPADVDDLLQVFIAKHNRQPRKDEYTLYIKAARQWREMGVTPAQVDAMFDYCREKGTVIKSPFSITFAYNEIRNQKQEIWEWV